LVFISVSFGTETSLIPFCHLFLAQALNINSIVNKLEANVHGIVFALGFSQFALPTF